MTEERVADVRRHEGVGEHGREGAPKRVEGERVPSRERGREPGRFKIDPYELRARPSAAPRAEATCSSRVVNNQSSAWAGGQVTINASLRPVPRCREVPATFCFSSSTRLSSPTSAPWNRSISATIARVRVATARSYRHRRAVTRMQTIRGARRAETRRDTTQTSTTEQVGRYGVGKRHPRRPRRARIPR